MFHGWEDNYGPGRK